MAMNINKTKRTSRKANISLPNQLKNLMLYIKWTDWHPLTRNLYQRMSSWAGVQGYGMKYSLAIYLGSFESENFLGQSQIGHKKALTTNIYTKYWV
jgi:hypothetical protein